MSDTLPKIFRANKPLHWAPYPMRQESSNWFAAHENKTSEKLRATQRPTDLTTTSNDHILPTTTLSSSFLSGTLEYDVKYIVSEMKAFLSKNTIDNKTITFNVSFDTVAHTITCPKTLIDKFMNEKVFLDTFFALFGVSFFRQFPRPSPHYPGLTLRLSTAEPAIYAADASKFVAPPVTLAEDVYFRQLTCLLLRKLFAIELDACSCYPTNASELLAWRSGIFKNCYSSMCTSWLARHPHQYDSLFVGPCSAAESSTSQTAIAFVKAAASQNISINVTIRQLIEDWHQKQQQKKKMAHWLTDHANLRQRFFQLPIHTPQTLTRFYCSRASNDRGTREVFTAFFNFYTQSLARATELFGGCGKTSAGRFIECVCTSMLTKLCDKVLPEMTYPTYVYLRQRGAHEVIEDCLKVKNLDFDAFCGALVVCRHMRSINKFCLETGLTKRMLLIDKYNGTQLTRTLIEDQPLLTAPERCINWAIERCLASHCVPRAFFSYAELVFKACVGDENLFKLCMENVDSITQTPSRLFDHGSRRVAALDIFSLNPTVYFALYFDSPRPASRCYVVDLAEHVSLEVGGIAKLTQLARNSGDVMQLAVLPSIPEEVAMDRSPDNRGCMGSNTVFVSFEATDVRHGVGFIFKNFQWQNTTHICLHGVRAYFLYAGSIFEINVATGCVRCVYKLAADVIFCQMVHGKVVVFNTLNRVYTIDKMPTSSQVSRVHNLKPYMFYSGKNYHLLKEFTGNRKGFLEMQRRLIYVEQPLFYGKLDKQLVAISREFIVKVAKTTDIEE